MSFKCIYVLDVGAPCKPGKQSWCFWLNMVDFVSINTGSILASQIPSFFIKFFLNSKKYVLFCEKKCYKNCIFIPT